MAAAAPQNSLLTLGGVAVNSETGQPVTHALIQIVHVDVSRQHGRPVTLFSASTFSDAAGAFHFDGLAAGFYNLSAEKPQFHALDADTRVELNASKTDVQLKLSPLSVITGKVTDQDGLPLLGVHVIALSLQFSDGRRQARTVRSVSTDDRGMFRLWNLAPAKYYLKAAGRSGGTYSFVGDTTPTARLDETFVPAYFGGGRTLDAAAPLDLKPGVEIPANLSVQLVPGYKIRGTLLNRASRGAVKFELLMGDESITPRVSLNQDTGLFEIQDIAAGSYRLRATQDSMSAEVALNVGRTDLSGVALRFVPPVDIREVVRYNNSAEGGSDGRGRGLDGSICGAHLQRTGITLEAEYSPTDYQGNESILKQVLPGTYRVCVRCYGGYASSVMFGSQDLLSNPLVEIQPGAAPPPIEIAATHGGGSIRGTVSIADYGGDTVLVLIVPQFAGSTGPFSAVGFRQQGEAAGWEFDAPNLAPGSYTAYAFPSAPQIEFRNPEFLKALRGGTTVQVAAQSEAQVTITEMAR